MLVRLKKEGLTLQTSGLMNLDPSAPTVIRAQKVCNGVKYVVTTATQRPWTEDHTWIHVGMWNALFDHIAELQWTGSC